jgi:hypothetical protein
MTQIDSYLIDHSQLPSVAIFEDFINKLKDGLSGGLPKEVEQALRAIK